MSNLHPLALSEAGEQNAYDAGHKSVLGRPIPQLIHRLDALILVLKTCKTDQCRAPWKQLHPAGGVRNLLDALDSNHDDFYEKTYEEGKVGWEKCYQGSEASRYELSNERPLWADVQGTLFDG
jgi:hypothetical protein